MSLTIPTSTRAVLDAIDAERRPALDYEIAEKLSGLHQADGLTDPERK